MSIQNQINNEAKELIRKHVLTSLQYLENGQLMLEKKEGGKASELLWGSVALAVQSVAESRNIQLSSHRSLRWFVSELSRESNDKSINNAFYQAEALHSNFHSVDLAIRDIATNVGAIRALVFKLLSFIPPELTRQ